MVMHSSFVEGRDSYSTELDRWKRCSTVEGLLGVFEIPADQFHETALEELLADFCGQRYSLLAYESEFEVDSILGDRSPIGMALTMAVKDASNTVRSLILIRKEIDPPPTEPLTAEVLDRIRLMLLMHELGHADDIAKGINFDHSALKLDFVAAEAYAEEFVLRNALRLGYRRLLGSLLKNLKLDFKDPDATRRLPAQRVLQTLDMAPYEAAALFTSQN
jgi:hypothetical protein